MAKYSWRILERTTTRLKPMSEDGKKKSNTGLGWWRKQWGDFDASISEEKPMLLLFLPQLTHLPKRTKICMRISGIGKNWICTAVNASLWARRDTSTRRTRDVTCVISWVNPGLIYETWPRICCYASTTQAEVFEFGALITLCSISVG